MCAKYLKRKKNRAGKAVLFVMLICVFLGGLLFFLNKLPEILDPGYTEPQIETTVPEDRSFDFETEEVIHFTEEPEAVSELEMTFFITQFSTEDFKHLDYRKVMDGDIIMEIFSMKTETDLIELFRLYFGDPETGNLLGTLQVDRKKIPVSITVCEYQDDFFEDEQTRELYYSMMDCMNTVLTALDNTAYFVSKSEVVIEKVESQMQDWNLSLPANVVWEETSEDGTITVTFYGLLYGGRFKLYSVALGDDSLKNVLGYYTKDGVVFKVSVESYEMPLMVDWTESAQTEFFNMMDSINEVIQAIMSSDNFSEQAPKS